MGWAWLSEFLQMFADTIPRPLIVRTDERTIEFRFGCWPRVLMPGWYIEWPLLARYETVPVMRQVTSRSQRFGKQAYRWKVVYEIEDALALVSNTYDFDETIADFGEIAFSSVYRRGDHPDMFSVAARRKVLGNIRNELKSFGVKVIDFAVVSQSAADRQFSIWELGKGDI